MSVGMFASTAHADIYVSGDVDPSNPLWWNPMTYVKIGQTGFGSVTVDGDSDATPYSFMVGVSGSGSLTIRDGGTASTESAYIGRESGSIGLVTISGAGATWTNSGTVWLGEYGSGTLSIWEGGTVSSDRCDIGWKSGSVGLVTVAGAGATWTTSRGLGVGVRGNGTLDIDAGGTVSNRYVQVGHESGSAGVVTVSGLGATWTSLGSMSIGTAGSGVLEVTDGGIVNVPLGIIGNSGGSTGEVTISGIGSTLNNSKRLLIGSRGDGILNIADGGLVMVSEETRVAVEPGSSGSLGFDNGALITGGLWVSPDDMSGTGTIDTTGLVSDLDLVFDAARGPTQTLVLNGPGRNITVNLNADGSGPLGAGYSGSGSMHISDGVSVRSAAGSLGQHLGSSGVATVSGAGSVWRNSGEDFHVGYSGDGRLNIVDGGLVEVTYETQMAVNDGSSGEIHFDSGTLTTGGFVGASDNLTGTGVVNTTGLLTDLDLVFDSSRGPVQTLTLNGPGRNITINLDADGSASMGAGYSGSGAMRISGGVTVQSTYGVLGYHSGSTGAATINGSGSSWTSSAVAVIGYRGDGTLDIAGGGAVGSGYGYIGWYSGSTGAVTVSGSGSNWTVSNGLYVGYLGEGILEIGDGGSVNSRSARIASGTGSSGAVTVSGSGSIWTNSSYILVGGQGRGRLNITNGGVVRSEEGSVGTFGYSSGAVTVSGSGSTWTNSSGLKVGEISPGVLDITDGGLVSVGGVLTIDRYGTGDSFINMASGGMLALFGDADDSLGSFLALIEGTDDIRYWDDSVSDWAPITSAAPGEDYTLVYLTEGDLDGYTVLTVTAVPEPATLSLLAMGGLALIRRRKRGACR